VAEPPVDVILPSPPAGDLTAGGITVAEPPVDVILPSPPAGDLTAGGITVAEPPVDVILPSPPTGDLTAGGITVAEPPVDVILPSPPTGDLSVGGVIVAEPFVIVDWAAEGVGGGSSTPGGGAGPDEPRLLAVRLEEVPVQVSDGGVERHVVVTPWVTLEWVGPASARFWVESSADLAVWQTEAIEEVEVHGDRWTGRCRSHPENLRFYRVSVMP
jgi:hypothetical protein